MNNPTKRTFSKLNWPRVVAITVLAPVVALALFAIVAAQGDPDLPPFIPATMVERACSVVAAVIVWPAVVAAKWWRDGDNLLLMWALFLLAGLVWALSFELLAIIKHARKP